MAIWTWPPASISENTEQFAEIITVSESGYEKRRQKASRPLWSGVYNYFNRNVTERYEMSAFLRARKGPHEWFYLPSFMWDAYLTSAYSSGTTLTVNSNTNISDAFDYGRIYIWLINNSGQNEVATVTNINGSTQIYISSELTYDYETGSEIDICYRARLSDSAFAFADNSYFKHDIAVPFREVR